jgi:sugar fermentation stimulation protein A
VKNTGRCRELLLPGVTVYLEASANPLRKTGYDLIAVEKVRPGKAPLLVNMDSQIPNRLAAEYVKNGGLGFVPDLVKTEQTYGNSRFDVYYEAGERKGFVEVKGVTLEEDGVARFPDAPTERGRKHLLELQSAAANGYEAWVLFVIQMPDILRFEPNWPRDSAFAEALCQVSQNGVRVRAVECTVTPDSLTISKPIPLSLSCIF